MKRTLLFSALMTFFLTFPALAHFQMIYTPQSALERGGEMTLKLVFTHPFDASYTMDMAPPEAFYMVHQRGEAGAPQTTDLKEFLQEITWKSKDNIGKAFEARLPARLMRSMGDYIFVLTPAPYYEEADEGYIQQITRMIMNIGGIPGNWHEPLGLPAEIVPLDKPYANWTGGIFRGIVMSEGKPVPHAELEIEYLNYAPDMQKNAFGAEAGIEAPHPAFESMGMRANERGEFAIGLPKAGWWGIAALGVVELEHEGRDMVQEAVLWIQVTDIP